jgi:hypothetical protein
LAPPLDLIARPEDCADKVLTKRPDKRRFAASYRRIHAGRETRNQFAGTAIPPPGFFLSTFPNFIPRLIPISPISGAIAPWPSPYPQCIRSSILTPDHASETALDPNPRHKTLA